MICILNIMYHLHQNTILNDRIFIPYKKTNSVYHQGVSTQYTSSVRKTKKIGNGGKIQFYAS